jgi:hypothetical protein
MPWDPMLARLAIFHPFDFASVQVMLGLTVELGRWTRHRRRGGIGGTPE